MKVLAAVCLLFSIAAYAVASQHEHETCHASQGCAVAPSDDDHGLFQKAYIKGSPAPHETIIGGKMIDSETGETIDESVPADGIPPANIPVGMSEEAEKYYDEQSKGALDAFEAGTHQAMTVPELPKDFKDHAAKLLEDEVGALAVAFINAMHDMSKYFLQTVTVEKVLSKEADDDFKATCKKELQWILGHWVEAVNEFNECGSQIIDAVTCAEITRCWVGRAAAEKKVPMKVFATVVELEELLAAVWEPQFLSIFDEVAEQKQSICDDELAPEKMMSMLQNLDQKSQMGMAIAVVADIHKASSMMKMNSTFLDAVNVKKMWEQPCKNLGCSTDSWMDVMHHLHGHTASLVEIGANTDTVLLHVKSMRSAHNALLTASHSSDVLELLATPGDSQGTDRYNGLMSSVGGIVDAANAIMSEQPSLVSESSTSGWGRRRDRRRRRARRRRRDPFKAVTSAAKSVVKHTTKAADTAAHTVGKVSSTVVNGVTHTVKQVAKVVLTFFRNLWQCLGISVSTTEGYAVTLEKKVKTAKSSISIGGMIGLSGGSKRQSWSRDQIYYMFKKFLSGGSFCFPSWMPTQLELSVAASQDAGNCAQGCASRGISASTKYPKSGSQYGLCVGRKFDHVMTAASTSISYANNDLPSGFKVGRVRFDPVKVHGVSVAASCCRLKFGPGGGLDCAN